MQGRKSAERPIFLRTTEDFGYLFGSGSSGLGRDHVLRQAEAPTGRVLSRRDITTLGALLHQPEGRRALAGRLDKRCVAPYTAGDLAVFDLTNQN